MKKLLGLISILIEMFIMAFIVITIVFFVMQLVPGADSISSNITDPALKKIIEHKYGYDQDVVTRWWMYIKNIFHGDFGISTALFPNQEINSFIWSRVWVSFSIGITSLFIAHAIGFPLGLYIGQRAGKSVDTAASFAIAILVSIPSIVFSLLLILLGRKMGIPYIFDKSNLYSYTLPLLAMSLGAIAAVMKITRVQTVAETNAQYARFAAVKGASKRRFVWYHAAKPASFLVVSGLPGKILGSIIGSMFIEQIFQIPGSGAILISAINTKDINVIMFIVGLFTIITVISYKLRDLLYAVLDPRIRKR